MSKRKEKVKGTRRFWAQSKGRGATFTKVKTVSLLLPMKKNF
jgi:hypothetical protein